MSGYVFRHWPRATACTLGVENLHDKNREKEGAMGENGANMVKKRRGRSGNDKEAESPQSTC